MNTHNVDGAPAAIGPYSHAASHSSGATRLVFCSGQTPIDPASNTLVGDTIEQQTERVLDNLELVLGGFGADLSNVVKTNCYLRSMDDFEGMNSVYGRRFGDHRPARTTVAVKANPLDAMVEIECVAEVPA